MIDIQRNDQYLNNQKVLSYTHGDYQILTFMTGRWNENSYLVIHQPTKNFIAVDPGGREDELIKTILTTGGQLKLILLTHAHHDHLGAVQRLGQQYDLPFFLHEGDKKLLQRVPLYAMSIEQRKMHVPQNHRFLNGGEIFWDGEPVKYLHIPGHTQGSVCYFWGGLAFPGDTLLNCRVGRTDLPGANPDILNDSINKMLYSLPVETIMFPGHFKSWYVAEAREWWSLQDGCPPQYLTEGVQ